jgi:hypothetical protein
LDSGHLGSRWAAIREWHPDTALAVGSTATVAMLSPLAALEGVREVRRELDQLRHGLLEKTLSYLQYSTVQL